MVVVGGFGNPLIDITVKITNDDLLRKYNLKENTQKEITEQDMKFLISDVSQLVTPSL